MHIIPEWDGTWVRQKVACFKVWGQKTLYPVVRTRFLRSFTAMHSSIPRMAGHLAHYRPATRRNDDGLHPTRASERGRAKGRPDDTLEQVFKPDNRVSTKQHIRISIGRYRSPHRVSGNYLSCLEPHHLFAMRFKIFVVWMLNPGPPRWPGQDQNTLMVGIYTIE